ncbi:MAG: DUF2845 domain-containing protein [Gammaproteobacteria bacterium]
MNYINLFLFALVIISGTADADSLRCGRKLIQTGDHKLDVLKRCGEPEYADQRLGLSGSRFRYPRGTLEIDQYEQVVIDEWIYNFGPTQFKQFLLFENGILQEIRDLDYGD